jgi:hypothetical protein
MKMASKGLLFSLPAALLLLGVVPAAWAGPAAKDEPKLSLREGEWEITTLMEGKPLVKKTECIRDDEKGEKREKHEDGPRDDSNDVEEAGAAPQEAAAGPCKETTKFEGNRMTGHTVCSFPDFGTTSEITMEMTFSKESYQGTTITKNTDKAGKTTVSKGTVSARWVGAKCKDEEK